MRETDLVPLFTHELEKAGLRYFVTGSIAGMLYGEPRLTMDIDVVLILSLQEAEKLKLAFPNSDFYCPPLEILKIEIARAQRGHFNIIHHQSGFKADIYLARTDPLHTWAFTKTRQLVVQGQSVCFAPPEYVILRKLEFYKEGASEKHLRDIRAMFEHSASEIDLEALEDLVEKQGLSKEWVRLKATIKTL